MNSSPGIADIQFLRSSEFMAKDRQQLVDHVRRWGVSASTILFDDSCHIFKSESVEGVIGYRLVSNCAVVFGDPLCSHEDIPTLIKEFHDYCHAKAWKIVYVTVSEKFAKWAIHNGCGSLIEVGEELILDPHRNPRSGSKGRALRNKVNNSIRAGIQVSEYKGDRDAVLERSLEFVGESWLKARQGPQIYLASVQLFAERIGKRWFYAKHENQVIGVLLLHQLEVRQGWLVQFLMTTPEAPVGTSEQLVVSALQTLQREGCHCLSFGVVQREVLGEIIGLNVFFEWLARIIFKIAKKTFHLDRRRRYWRKFQPQKEPSYLLFGARGIGFQEIRGVMKALNVSYEKKDHL